MNAHATRRTPDTAAPAAPTPLAHPAQPARAHVVIGTAGWGIPRDVAAAFPGSDAQLDRYARGLNGSEINTTFSKTHRPDTFTRWATQTPGDFRFSVKLPRAFTHDARLKVPRADIRAFFESMAGMGGKLAVALIQLPPSLALDAETRRAARALFRSVHAVFDGAVVLEPRHRSWFEPEAHALLVAERIGRVAADPAIPAGAAEPGGWLGDRGDGVGAVVYYRWHGSPKVYWSAYDDAWLAARAEEIRRWPTRATVWCVFDNTAAGAATADALRLQALLRPGG